MKIALYVLIAVIVLLQYPLWFGNGSMVNLWRLEQEIDAQKAENARLRERNAALEAEVLDLKTGLSAIEARARAELGMIKKDETFFQVIGSPEKQATRRSQRDSSGQ